MKSLKNALRLGSLSALVTLGTLGTTGLAFGQSSSPRPSGSKPHSGMGKPGPSKQPKAAHSKARNTPDQGKQANERMEKTHQVSGTVLETKKVSVGGLGKDNLVVLLQTTKKDRRLVVDLGPAQEIEVDKGQKIAVEGVVARIGDAQVLVANRMKPMGEEGGKTAKVQKIERMKQIAAFQKDQKY